MAVIAGLLSGVVYAKPLLRPETRLWPPAALFAGCARGHNLKQALPPEVLRRVLHRGRLGGLPRRKGHGSCPRRALPPTDPGQDRAMAPDHEEPCSARALLPARRSRAPDQRLCRILQQPALPREPWKPDARRRLLRARRADPETARGDQATNHAHPALAPSN